jgi:DNA replication protein DnaC
VDKNVTRALVQESAWVAKRENVFMLRPTGVGKSFAASALAQKRMPRWLLGAAHPRPVAVPQLGDGPCRREPSQSAGPTRCIDVLAIDDWAMAPLSEPERRDFWEICEDRYQVRSTILTSQLPDSR